MEADGTVYCLCRQTYDGNGFMIECDVCKDWFHGSCVGIQEHQATDIEIYHCPNCQVEHGPLVLKKRRNWHRHDYSETDENIARGVQTGTFVFVQELKARTFASSDEIPVLRLHGSELTVDYFEQNGFDIPILVDKKDGLDLKVPPPNFSIQDVELYVGSMREIDVIDVSRQEDVKMLMREWTEYYNSPNRSKILNVISLEFSGTKLADLVDPPAVVKEISWVHQLWPDNIQDGEEVQFAKPEVQRYCLMGVKDSFTDFHVDFGGTSVWYHVLRGEKVFYLIRPTTTNLSLYERWVSSAAQSETFFGDQADACYKCTVKAGQTMFIPTGWIHAVLTPIDSLVFGGNFLHSYNIDLQIQIHEIEKKVNTPEKYLFPNYETVHWYAAKYVYDIIKEANEDSAPVAEHIANGAKALAAALKGWTSRKDFSKRETVPETVQYSKLLKDLNKEMKILQQRGFTKARKGIDAKKKKIKKKEDLTLSMGMTSPSFNSKLNIQGEGFSKITFGKVDLSPIDKPQMSDLDALLNLQAPSGGPPSTGAPSAGPSPQMLSPHASAQGLSGLLKVRIPKPGAYMLEQQMREDKDISVYDFKDDPDDNGSTSPTKSPTKSPLARIKSPGLSLSTTPLPPSFMLKVSAGKLQGSKSPVASSVPGYRSPGATPLSPKALSSSCPALGKPALGRPQVKDESESDNDDNLVVDENPPAKRPRMDSKAKAGSLKLKLPTSKDGESSDPRSMASPEQRANIPTIRGGLNCSIADILEASGYGTETDFKIDEDMGRASPSMRDAIQGMLSMSRMGGVQLGSDVFDIKPRAPLRTPHDQRTPSQHGPKNDDDIERMPSCYKDEEYVYPTLDLSDSEDEHVFKPRGRIKKDETWNPKAKLSPNCPKPERPQREGVRRESVESGLAAAAARLATQPPPKRQYIKKKPKPCKLQEPLPSTSLSHSAPASFLGPQFSSKKSGVTSPTAKRPKKGMATTKQRLSKILKIKF